ncbi:MAG: hypothetical protein HY423_05690 [Candidatus Lambdaproteobacteria bacterium]|nr:hypothetical protein [Candidatus Lambdaproteobacteria bacterium]
MNTRLFFRGIALVLVAAAWAASALAAPRYADKETALELAKALDKGVFRNHLISSTFIQSREPGGYILKVVLDNGAELNWDMNQIRGWSKDETLVLSRNRALLFLSEDTNTVAVFDKNQFMQKALRAKVYAKRHRDSDILAGQIIDFAIYNVNLVDLLELSPGRDEHGYRFYYVIDLENGQREFLSYLDAYEAITRNGLIADPAAVSPVLVKPYRLRELRPRELERSLESGTGRFSVEMVFDRPVELEPASFPFRLYERPVTPGTPRPANNFVVELTVPNAVLAEPVAGIDNLEFLQSIKAVSDPLNQVRVLLQARVNPDVFNFPPEVEVLKSNAVVVSFTKVVDQSVFDRKALHDAELRRRQERMLHRLLTPEEVKARNQFKQYWETGQAQLDRARQRTGFGERWELLLAARTNFGAAAEYATSDRELKDALAERNRLNVRLPELVIEQVGQALQTPPMPDVAGLRRIIETAVSMTRDTSVQQTLEELKKRLPEK